MHWSFVVLYYWRLQKFDICKLESTQNRKHTRKTKSYLFKYVWIECLNVVLHNIQAISRWFRLIRWLWLEKYIYIIYRYRCDGWNRCPFYCYKRCFNLTPNCIDKHPCWGGEETTARVCQFILLLFKLKAAFICSSWHPFFRPEKNTCIYKKFIKLKRRN